MDNVENAFTILSNRIQLLARGIIIPQTEGEEPIRHRQSFRGGAGPQGEKYYICSSEDETPIKMISLPVIPEDHYLSEYAIITKRGNISPENLITENGTVLKPVPSPHIKKMALSDGTPIDNVINIHCYDTAISSMSLACDYFETNEECKYCTADVLKKKMNLSWTKDEYLNYLVEALTLAVKHDTIRTISISRGTKSNRDETAKQFLEAVKTIKKVINRSIHIQLEPVSDLSLLYELSRTVDSVGIFLEVFDEKIRKEICPGKSKILKEQYFETWREAVKHFGKENVVTTCILGFGEDYSNILGDIEECIKLGVRVGILLLRPGSKNLGDGFIPSYLGKERELLDFYIKVAQFHVKYGVDFKLKNGSGCIGCQGCSAMMEACEYARLLS